MKIVNVNKEVKNFFKKVITMPTNGNEAELGCENGKKVMDRINI